MRRREITTFELRVSKPVDLAVLIQFLKDETAQNFFLVIVTFSSSSPFLESIQLMNCSSLL